MAALDIAGGRLAAALVLCLAAYALGSVNFSLLATRLLGLGDLRRLGSGNAGATNLARVAGKGPAACVLALDVARGAGVVLGARAAGMGSLSAWFALPLLLGNVFPAFHGFKGGKGVAASVGAVLAVSPLAFLASGGAFLAAFALGRRVSLGSLAMAACYPASVWLLGGSRSDALAVACAAAILFVTHRRNLARLARGEEPKLALRKRGAGGSDAP
jgi:acyl phosphate:glycerol-3-phosphate acyltransferase